MADFPFEQQGIQRTYAGVAGAGQSVLETVKEINRDKQQTRMLAAQIENQMLQTRSSALERQAEREIRKKELELRDREIKSLEDQRKMFSLGGGQGLFKYNQQTGKVEKQAEMPFNPGGGSQDTARYNALYSFVMGGVDPKDPTISHPGLIVRNPDDPSKIDSVKTLQNAQFMQPYIEKLGFTLPEVQSMLSSIGVRSDISQTPEIPTIPQKQGFNLFKTPGEALGNLITPPNKILPVGSASNPQGISVESNQNSRRQEYEAESLAARQVVTSGKITAAEATKRLKAAFPEYY